jgi:hypothetical protein
LRAEARTADPAEVPKGRAGFDELWEAWLKKQKRADAKAAYAALAPDAELHARLVEAATAWAAAYNSSGTEKKFQRHLHTWLKGEGWLEDLPEAFVSYKDAAIAKAKSSAPRKKEAVSDTEDSGANGITRKTPQGRHFVEVAGADLIVSDDRGNSTIVMDYCIRGGAHDGTEFKHEFPLTVNNDLDQEGGNLFKQVRDCTGIPNPQDTKEFVGKHFYVVVGRGGKINYGALQ